MTQDTLRLAIAQLNPVVGDVAGNKEKAAARARKQPNRMPISSSSPNCSSPAIRPEDLVLKPAFQPRAGAPSKNSRAKRRDGGPAMLVGTPWLEGGKLYNAAALLDGGRIAGLRFKVDLPNYGVFDEKRVFAPGPLPGPVNFRGIRIGVPVCEDIWSAEAVECIAETGAKSSSSPMRLLIAAA